MSATVWFQFSVSVFWSQQHGLLHSECLLCVPVVWRSEQLGELLPDDGLLLLELCPVVEQAVRVFWEGELWDGRHLGALEAGRARHPARRLRWQLDLRLPEPAYRPPRPALRREMQGVWLASVMPVKSVVHGGIGLRGGGELLQVDGGGASLVFQLQGGLLWRPGVNVVVGRARWWLRPVGGVGVVHEALLWGKAVVVSLSGGVGWFPVRHLGGWHELDGRTVVSVLSAVVVQGRVGRM